MEPYRVVHSSFRWYLLAYDLDRKDWRTFRVDRIGAGPKVGRRFPPRAPPTADVAAYVSQKVSTDVYRHRAKVTIHAPAHELSRRLSRFAGRIEELDGDRCLVQTGAESLPSLAFHLVMPGFEFEVHEPKALIDELRAMSERLARAVRQSA